LYCTRREYGLVDDADVAPRLCRVPIDARLAVDVQAGPSRAEIDGIARERRVAARVERDVRPDGP
jgi:hypothetical protein